MSDESERREGVTGGDAGDGGKETGGGDKRGGGGRARKRVDRRRFVIGAAAALAGLAAVLAGWFSGLFGKERTRVPLGPASTLLSDFPVREVEDVPGVPAEQWTIRVDGLVEHPQTLDHAAFMALRRSAETVDFHCVEGWSVGDVRWAGVPVADILAQAVPTSQAGAVSFHAYGGQYLDSLTIDQARDPQVLLADTLDDRPLPPEHGGPVRLVVPAQLGYKSVKWVQRIEVTATQARGYWENNGYPIQAPVGESLKGERSLA